MKGRLSEGISCRCKLREEGRGKWLSEVDKDAAEGGVVHGVVHCSARDRGSRLKCGPGLLLFA